MIYWIADKDRSPQRFPLQRLIRRVEEVAGIENPTCLVSKARGYGLKVRAIEERLESEDAIAMSCSELAELSAGQEEWFYELEARLRDVEIRFGLHDSTALFVEADPSTSREVASSFSDIRPAA